MEIATNALPTSLRAHVHLRSDLVAHSCAHDHTDGLNRSKGSKARRKDQTQTALPALSNCRVRSMLMSSFRLCRCALSASDSACSSLLDGQRASCASRTDRQNDGHEQTQKRVDARCESHDENRGGRRAELEAKGAELERVDRSGGARNEGTAAEQSTARCSAFTPSRRAPSLVCPLGRSRAQIQSADSLRESDSSSACPLPLCLAPLSPRSLLFECLLARCMLSARRGHRPIEQQRRRERTGEIARQRMASRTERKHRAQRSSASDTTTNAARSRKESRCRLYETRARGDEARSSDAGQREWRNGVLPVSTSIIAAILTLDT